MNPGDLYHQHGVREHVCTRAEYRSKTVVLHIKTKKAKLYCPRCKSTEVIRSGVVTRKFHTVPVGRKPVVLCMRVQRLECKHCHHVSQEHIHFADPQTTYTHRLAGYAVDLCRMASIKSVAAHLNLSWNTVKEMVKGYLQRHYSKPDISGLKVIGIDEFAVKKGHVYKTTVVDLDTGRIVYVGEGKGADALDGFWKMAQKAGVRIEAVASDLKEDARLVWSCESKRSAAIQLDSWIAAARAADIPELTKLAKTIESHRDGILAYFDRPISTGPVEGVNNKIKTLKRMAYGFRDEHYFILRLLALHVFKYS